MRQVCRSSIGIRLRHIRVRNREELAAHKKFWFLELSATKVPKCKRIERPSKQKDFQKMLKNPEGQILNLVWPPILRPVFKIQSIQLQNTLQCNSYLSNDGEKNEKSRWNNLLAKNLISFTHFVTSPRDLFVLSLLFVLLV